MQGMQVWPLVSGSKIPGARGATKPKLHNYRLCTLQILCATFREAHRPQKQDAKMFLLSHPHFEFYVLFQELKTVLFWEEEEIPWFVYPRISLAYFR